MSPGLGIGFDNAVIKEIHHPGVNRRTYTNCGNVDFANRCLGISICRYCARAPCDWTRARVSHSKTPHLNHHLALQRVPVDD